MGIKKIDIPQTTAIDASVLWGGINDNVLAAKINEVIDVVNELQNRIDPPSVYQVMKDKDAIIGKHIGEKQRMKDELDRTKKQLEIANDTLRRADWFFDGDYNVSAKDMYKEIKYAIKAISDIADYGQPITKGGKDEKLA